MALVVEYYQTGGVTEQDIYRRFVEAHKKHF